jgi:hypothetical protein
MPPRDRSGRRDVHIFDARDRNTSIGGLILTAGVTNANLHAMIEIFVIFKSEYSLQSESNVTIAKDDNSLLLPGNYYIDSDGKSVFNGLFSLANLLVEPIQINNETPLLRTISLQTGTRVQAFTDAVRSRDGQCVITGELPMDPEYNLWPGLEAAHIFPLAYEGIWKDHDYGRWISNIPDRGGTINSVQNGLLLRSDIHQLFDFYFFSINPDVCLYTLCS